MDRAVMIMTVAIHAAMLNRPCHVFSWSEAHQVSYQGTSLMFSSQREIGLMHTDLEVCLCKFDACSNAQVLCLLWLLKTHGHTGDQAKTHAEAALAKLPTSTTQGVLRVISMTREHFRSYLCKVWHISEGHVFNSVQNLGYLCSELCHVLE